MAAEVKPSPMFRITSDGTIIGTKIYDQHGKSVGRVIHAKWEVDIADMMPKLYLTITGAEIDAKGVPHITRRVDRTID